MNPRQVPILLLVYNRVDTLHQVLAVLREVRPSLLFVSGDGPKPTEEDSARVAAVRRFLQQSVDWPCEVYFRFLPENHGCRLGVVSGINWFFSQVTEGIILEDDTLPHPDFFAYAAEMLERYRDEPRVGSITGLQVLPGWKSAYAWRFIRIPLIWGWATWRRAWTGYDPSVYRWPQLRQEGLLERALADNLRLVRPIKKGLDLIHRGQLDTWDYQWVLQLLERGQLTVVPARNLIRNLGVAHPLALHTRKRRPWQHLPLEGWEPRPAAPAVEIDLAYERALAFYFASPPFWLQFWYRLGGDYPYRSFPVLRGRTGK
ncbi:MAG: hemolytic protein HlpA [Bacteroidia bacterium]|nr:MAG: hemolytic protein HlpA [Bacteroidia bacterium]